MELDNIYLGDAYGLIKSVPDKSIDLIITDPPYRIGGLRKRTDGLLAKRNYDTELIESNLGCGIDESILREFVRVQKKVCCFIFCNKEQIYDYMDFFVKKRKCNWEMLIWAKQNPPPFYGSHWLKDKEYCLHFWETGAKIKIKDFDSGRTVFFSTVNREDKGDYRHPCCKPEKLIEKLINAVELSGGGVIFDPFSGSGSTCAVAKRLGYRYLGFEISEKWHRIACDRLNGITASQSDAGIEQLRLF